MVKQFVVVQHQIAGTVDSYWSEYRDPLDGRFSHRADAIHAGVTYFEHDDFNIATLVDGRLAAFGWGNDPDFGPGDCDLIDIGRQLNLELASPQQRRVHIQPVDEKKE